MTESSVANILKLGNKVFTLMEIDCPNFNFENELREFHANRVEEEARSCREALTNESVDALNQQIDHVMNRRQAQSVAVPEDMYCQHIIVYNDTVLPVRFITYAPNRFKMQKGYLEGMIRNNSSILAIPLVQAYMSEDHNTDHKIVLTIESPYRVEHAGFALDPRSHQLYTVGFRTFHTYAGGLMCLGRARGEDFWQLNDDAFSDAINEVNCFSLAGKFIYGGHEYRVRHLITRESLISLDEARTSRWP